MVLIAFCDEPLASNPLQVLPEQKTNATFFKSHYRLSLKLFLKEMLVLYLCLGSMMIRCFIALLLKTLLYMLSKKRAMSSVIFLKMRHTLI